MLAILRVQKRPVLISTPLFRAQYHATGTRRPLDLLGEARAPHNRESPYLPRARKKAHTTRGVVSRLPPRKMQQAKSTKWSPGRMYALYVHCLTNVRWTFMTVSMFSSVFLIKSYNRTRKREYIASKIQEEGGTRITHAGKPRLQTLNSSPSNAVSPIESLLQNLSRQWDKKS